MDELRLKLSTEKPRIEREIKELQLYEKTQSAERKLSNAEYAKVIKDLGITLFEAIQILKEHQIPVVLTEADKVITKVERDYSSKSSLIGVHKTEFAPSGSIIRTLKDARVSEKDTIIINGQECEYEFHCERNTIHLSMNGEVSSHMYGSWEDCKYAYFKDYMMIMENIQKP